MSVTLRTNSDVEAAVGEPAAQDVVVEPGADVPDVRGPLHRGATHVDRRRPGAHRDEFPLLSRGGVVQAQAHPSRVRSSDLSMTNGPGGGRLGS